MAAFSLPNKIAVCTIVNSAFTNNTADSGGIMTTRGGSMNVINGNFDHNTGSFYTIFSNVTFSDYNKCEHCIEPINRLNSSGSRIIVIPQQIGGAITSYQSSIVFTGISYFLHNQASNGGAILATESTITIFSRVVIAKNVATNYNRGGIYLHQSNLNIKGYCLIINNHATRGGGVHASGSSITVYPQEKLHFFNNSAGKGSGIHLEVSSKLN